MKRKEDLLKSSQKIELYYDSLGLRSDRSRGAMKGGTVGKRTGLVAGLHLAKDDGSMKKTVSIHYIKFQRCAAPEFK